MKTFEYHFLKKCLLHNIFSFICFCTICFTICLFITFEFTVHKLFYISLQSLFFLHLFFLSKLLSSFLNASFFLLNQLWTIVFSLFMNFETFDKLSFFDIITFLH